MAWQLGSLLLWVALLRRTAPAAAGVECYAGEGGFTREVWPHCQAVSEGVLVYYGSPSGDTDYLMLGLHVADHSGWSALALAGNGGMRGASMVVVRKVDGVFIAEDRYATAYDVPALDDSQDVLLIFAEEALGGVSWGVLMPVNSCDEQDYPVQNHSRWMLWAVGGGDAFDWSTFHGGNRGQFHANLISGPADEPDLGETDEVDVLMSNVPVVAGEDGSDESNPYICQMSDLRQLINETLGDVDGDKLHAVKMSALLDPDSEPYVHHMILYWCQTELPFFEHGHVIGSCRSMPAGCNRLQYAWAKGSQDIVMPDAVGLPFALSQPWLALQMHYYNPSRVEGIRDSSGVRLSFARELKEQDAGIVTFNGGTNGRQREPIPPGESDFELRPFNVPAACTNRFAQDINVLALAYHQHLTGKRMNIDVIREGTNLGPLRLERAFDFNHQSLEEPAIPQIHRGDRFVVTCSYDTSSRTGPTEFGEASEDEMCWAGMLYWPAQDMRTFSYTPTIVEGQEVTWCNSYVVGDSNGDAGETCRVQGDVTSAAAASHAELAGRGRTEDQTTVSASRREAFALAILVSVFSLAWN